MFKERRGTPMGRRRTTVNSGLTAIGQVIGPSPFLQIGYIT